MRDEALRRTRDEITRWIDEGASLNEVDVELIAPVDELSEEERSALWLYAWHRSSGDEPSDRQLLAVLN